MSYLINKNTELPSYRSELHKLNEEPISSLKNIYGIKYSLNRRIYTGLDLTNDNKIDNTNL